MLHEAHWLPWIGIYHLHSIGEALCDPLHNLEWWFHSKALTKKKWRRTVISETVASLQNKGGPSETVTKYRIEEYNTSN